MFFSVPAPILSQALSTPLPPVSLASHQEPMASDVPAPLVFPASPVFPVPSVFPEESGYRVLSAVPAPSVFPVPPAAFFDPSSRSSRNFRSPAL